METLGFEHVEVLAPKTTLADISLTPSTGSETVDDNSHHASINRYYDSAAVQFFEHITQQQIHLGYWDPRYPGISLAQAAKRLTSVIIEQLNVNPVSHLLDIGCGCGMPAIEIMQRKGCRVDGITINPQQQQKAKEMAERAKLNNHCHFVLGDATRLPYPGEYFDCTLLLESIHHIGHEQAIAEAQRVLKPGGQILIADGVALKDGATESAREWLSETFIAKSLLNERSISEILIINGFSNIEVIDVTRAIQPTWSKLISSTEQLQASITLQHGAAVYQNMSDFWKRIDQIWSDHARYLIIKACKL